MKSMFIGLLSVFFLVQSHPVLAGSAKGDIVCMNPKKSQVAYVFRQMKSKRQGYVYDLNGEEISWSKKKAADFCEVSSGGGLKCRWRGPGMMTIAKLSANGQNLALTYKSPDMRGHSKSVRMHCEKY